MRSPRLRKATQLKTGRARSSSKARPSPLHAAGPQGRGREAGRRGGLQKGQQQDRQLEERQRATWASTSLEPPGCAGDGRRLTRDAAWVG